MNIYILAAWDNYQTTHPTILTFTKKSEAIEFARMYRDDLHFVEVSIRRDYKGIPQDFIEF